MRIVLFSLCFLLSFHVFAQSSKTDSLSVLINKTDNIKEKIILLIKRSKSYASQNTDLALIDAELALKISQENNNEIGESDSNNQLAGLNIRLNNYQKGEDYAQKALLIAQNNDYKLGVLSALNYLGSSNNSKGDTKLAISFLSRGLQLAKEINNKTEIATINNTLGVSFNKISEYEKSLACYNEALENVNQKKEGRLLSLIYMNKANVLSKQSKFEDAVGNYLAGLKIQEAQNDQSNMVKSYNNLGILFRQTKQFVDAKRYFKKAIYLSKIVDNKKSLALSYNNLAIACEDLKQKDSLLYYRKNAITILEQINDEPNLAMAYHNLGHYYLLNEKLDEAEPYLKTALNLREKINFPTDVASTKTSLGILYDKKGDLVLAEKYLLEAQSLLKNEINIKKEALLIALSSHYRIKGELDKALKLKDEQLALQDSMYQKDELVSIVKQEKKYVLDQKNAEILSIQSFKNKYKNNKITFGILLFITFLIALYSFLRWKKSDFKQQTTLKEKNLLAIELNQTDEELKKTRQLIIEDHIVLKNKTKIYLNELIYIKSDDHYLEILTSKKKEYLRGSILEILKELPPNFVQCHRSYIINKNYIQSLNSNEIVLKGDLQVPISRKFKNKLDKN